MISVLTDELVKNSAPSAEATIRKILINALAYNIDSKFLDSTITAVAYVCPASITAGTTPRGSTGSTSALIATDLSAMTDALVTWKDACWVMRPKTLSYISGHNDGNILQYIGTQPMLLNLPVYTAWARPRKSPSWTSVPSCLPTTEVLESRSQNPQPSRWTLFQARENSLLYRPLLRSRACGKTI